MADQLTLGQEADSLAAFPPFTGTCPVCHDPVLVLEVHGQDVVAEVPEVVERFPCPQCGQVAEMGHRRSRCLRCTDGHVGEPLPAFGVAVAESGVARYFTGERGDGEAVHREHVCRL